MWRRCATDLLAVTATFLWQTTETVLGVAPLPGSTAMSHSAESLGRATLNARPAFTVALRRIQKPMKDGMPVSAKHWRYSRGVSLTRSGFDVICVKQKTKRLLWTQGCQFCKILLCNISCPGHGPIQSYSTPQLKRITAVYIFCWICSPCLSICVLNYIWCSYTSE